MVYSFKLEMNSLKEIDMNFLLIFVRQMGGWSNPLCTMEMDFMKIALTRLAKQMFSRTWKMAVSRLPQPRFIVSINEQKLGLTRFCVIASSASFSLRELRTKRFPTTESRINVMSERTCRARYSDKHKQYKFIQIQNKQMMYNFFASLPWWWLQRVEAWECVRERSPDTRLLQHQPPHPSPLHRPLPFLMSKCLFF